MTYSAKISFKSMTTGERATRQFSTDNMDAFLKWLNSYLKMPLRQQEFHFDEISLDAQKRIHWPKQIRKFF